MIDDPDLTVRNPQSALGGVLSTCEIEALAPGALAMFDYCCPDLAERDDVVFCDVAHAERRWCAAAGAPFSNRTIPPRIYATAPARDERLELALRTSVTARRAFAHGETREAVLEAGWTTAARWFSFGAPDNVDFPGAVGLWLRMSTNVKINPKRSEPRSYPVDVCCKEVPGGYAKFVASYWSSSKMIRPRRNRRDRSCVLCVGHDGPCEEEPLKARRHEAH